MDNATFYDKRYQSENNYSKDFDFYRLFIKFLKKRYPLAPLEKGKNAIDLGCGTGALLRHFEILGFSHTYGCDYSNVAIDRLRDRFANVFVQDICNPIDVEVEFDLITAFEVFEHLEEPERAIQNIVKKLKKDGLLVFTTPFPNTSSHFTDVSIKHSDEWRAILESTNMTLDCYPVKFVNLIWRMGFPLLEVKPENSTTVIYVAKHK